MAELTKRGQIPVERSSAEQLLSPGKSYSPDVNIYDNKEALIFTMDIPGVHKGDVNVEIDENNVLSIKAKDSFKEPEGTSLLKEFDIGDYYRAFTISNEFDKDKISGKLENGVLEIIIPRREEVKPKKIQISA
ncbi:MAG TPA: Hsp20/alpha crystallin family protein [Chitinispirillaceae bacterium]|jgi:HSP20 family molecular chaperone IbpA|nr:Hsp20/alpha crystallin family protein [Chitinispirillaceae bacterium]